MIQRVRTDESDIEKSERGGKVVKWLLEVN